MATWYLNLNAGSDAADGTTPATAWLTFPHAFASMGGAASGPHELVVCGTYVAAGTLDLLGTYGNPGTKNLLIRGDGLAAFGDGGRPFLNLSAASVGFFDGTGTTNVTLDNLKVSRASDSNPIVAGVGDLIVRNCVVDFLYPAGGGNSRGFIADRLLVERCNVYNIRIPYGVLSAATTLVVTDSYVESRHGVWLTPTVGGNFSNPDGYLARNVFTLYGTGMFGLAAGPLVRLGTGLVEHNSFYVLPEAAGWATSLFSIDEAGVFRNNVVVGASGTGGVGFVAEGNGADAVGNVIYNTMTMFGSGVRDRGGNVIASENPLVDPAAGDFRTKELPELARTIAWPGYVGPTAYPTRYAGAVPPATGGGGGGVNLSLLDRLVTRFGGRRAT